MAYTFGQASQSIKTKEEVPATGKPVVNTGQYTFGKASQTTEGEPSVSQETPSKDGILKSILKGIVEPTATLLARPWQLAKALGGASEEEQAVNLPGIGKIETSKSGTDVIKDIGRGAETVALGLGGGVVKDAFGNVVKQTTKQAVKTGAIEGLKAGALGGAGLEVEKTGNLESAIPGAIKGGAFGSVAGGAIPVVIAGAGKVAGGVKSGFASRAAKDAEVETLLRNGVPDARTATKTLEEGAVVKDKLASEVVRQGIPEADVALIKSGSQKDKEKMLKMLDVRKSQLTNKRVTERATDVVGDTFIERVAKPLQAKNREAGKQLEQVAKSLAGKKVDPTSAITKFAQELESSGITVTSKGILKYKNSAFEGLKGPQQAINNVWARALRVAKSGDALQLHRLKSYIDEIVNYGKATEGLSGRAEGLLKKFRHSADEVLDTTFDDYNLVNTVFSDTIQELNKIGDILGRSFKIGDEFADAQAGLAMRRIMSNTKSRAEVLQLLDSAQKIGKKYGIQIDEDIITQANFADVLEKMLGTEAPTSLMGQVERGVAGAEQAMSAGADLAQGNLIRGTIKAGKYAIDVTRGVNQENKMNALRALLEADIGKAKPRTNFGRPKK